MTSFPLRLRTSLSEHLGPCTCDELRSCRLCRTVARGVELHNSWRAARRRKALQLALELFRAPSLSPEEIRLQRELKAQNDEPGDETVADEAWDSACRANGVRWDRAFDSKGVSL